MQQRTQVERRQRNIRLTLVAIIFITLPFYCAGLILWGTAKPKNFSEKATLNPAATTPFVPPTSGIVTASPTPTIPVGVTLLPPITIVVPTSFIPTATVL